MGNKLHSEKEIENNRSTAPDLPENIKPRQKMHHNHDGPPLARDSQGNLLGYCKYTYMYYPIDEMAVDSYRPFGIKPMCRTFANQKAREKYAEPSNNGNGHLPNNPIVRTASNPAEKAVHMEKVKEIWDKVEDKKDMTFAKLLALGLDDKMKFIYMTRWLGICDEFRKEMEDIIGENKEPYYVGQTNGRKMDYNGSGSSIDDLKALAKKYPNVEVETRIIQITDLQETDDAERQLITETGAIRYGINNLEGSSKAQSIPIKFSLDPNHPKEYEYYNDLVNGAKESGLSKEELAKKSGIYGNAAQKIQITNLKKAHACGEVIEIPNF